LDLQDLLKENATPGSISRMIKVTIMQRFSVSSKKAMKENTVRRADVVLMAHRHSKSHGILMKELTRMKRMTTM